MYGFGFRNRQFEVGLAGSRVGFDPRGRSSGVFRFTFGPCGDDAFDELQSGIDQCSPRIRSGWCTRRASRCLPRRMIRRDGFLVALQIRLWAAMCAFRFGFSHRHRVLDRFRLTHRARYLVDALHELRQARALQEDFILAAVQHASEQ